MVLWTCLCYCFASMLLRWVMFSYDGVGGFEKRQVAGGSC